MDEPDAATAASYARVLHDLLPEPGAGGGKVPGGLRVLVARALGATTLPRLTGARAFGEGLRRFAPDPPGEAIVAVLLRWAEAASRSAPAARNERRQSGPTISELRRQLHESDLDRYALMARLAQLDGGRRAEDVALRIMSGSRHELAVAAPAGSTGQTGLRAHAALDRVQRARKRARHAARIVADRSPALREPTQQLLARARRIGTTTAVVRTAATLLFVSVVELGVDVTPLTSPLPVTPADAAALSGLAGRPLPASPSPMLVPAVAPIGPDSISPLAGLESTLRSAVSAVDSTAAATRAGANDETRAHSSPAASRRPGVRRADSVETDHTSETAQKRQPRLLRWVKRLFKA
jgi:hypothetical protein